MFLTSIPTKREWLINNGYTFIRFLAGSISQFKVDKGDIAYDLPSSDSEEPPVELALDKEAKLTSTTDGRDPKMLVVQNTLTDDLHSLERLSNKGFIVNTSNYGLWNGLPPLVSYLSGIIQPKNVSASKHVLAIVKPCHRCIAKIMDFETMDKCDMRHELHT